MRVLFVAIGGEDTGSTRMRIYRMLPFLDEAGISHTVTGPGYRQFFDNVVIRYVFYLTILLRAPLYDVVYIQKLQFNPLYIRWLSRLARATIYEFDDSLHTTPPWEDDERSEEQLHRFEKMLSSVDLVLAGSESGAEYAKQHASSVRWWPGALPRGEYVEASRDQSETEGVTLGWIGNPENLNYLITQEDAITTVLDAHDDTELVIITAGEKPVVPFADRRGDDVFYKEWSLESEIDYLASTDIGIRPLSDDEWTRGKGGFPSVTQFMALGKPVVVTPVGLLSSLVVDGENGFHATDEKEWVDSLNALVEDESRREEIGKKAFETIETEHGWNEDRAENLIETLQELSN